MPKRRAESPVAFTSQTSSIPSPVASTSTQPLRQSKRRKVLQVPAEPSQPSQKKSKSPLKSLRKKAIKAKLAATMSIQVKKEIKDEPGPLTPDSLSEIFELPSKVEEELETLRKQLAAKDETIQAQHQALTAVHQQVQCQICLDTLIRPYSLVPCGHVACLGCLQQWFRAPGPDTDVQPPTHVIVRRKKTCPHCRALVVQRPVAAFLIREIITQVEATLNPNAAPTLNASDAPREEDPWKNIFPAQYHGATHTMGGAIIDHGEGGVRRCNTCLTEIFEGVCQGCGEVYDIYDSEESDLDMGFGQLPYLDYLLPPFEGPHRPFMDEDEDEDEELDIYESDFVVDEDEGEGEGDGDSLIGIGRERRVVPQETIEISDDSDDATDLVIPRYAHGHRLGPRGGAGPIILSDDDLSDEEPPEEWGRAHEYQHHQHDPESDQDDGLQVFEVRYGLSDGDDEEEEEDVNWELQHPSMQGHTYDDDEGDGVPPVVQYFYESEAELYEEPHSLVDEDEAAAYSDEY